MESTKNPEPSENSAVEKSVANQSLRSMYLRNREDSEDIMVIDTVGDRPEELPPPQSTPYKVSFIMVYLKPVSNFLLSEKSD